MDPSEWQVPPHCVPIHANVTTYNWKSLYQQTQFDVIMMDPPWQLATSNPTRGIFTIPLLSSKVWPTPLCFVYRSNFPMPKFSTVLWMRRLTVNHTTSNLRWWALRSVQWSRRLLMTRHKEEFFSVGTSLLLGNIQYSRPLNTNVWKFLNTAC